MQILKFIGVILLSLISTAAAWFGFVGELVERTVNSSCGTGSIGEWLLKAIVVNVIVFIILAVVFYVMLFVLL